MKKVFCTILLFICVLIFPTAAYAATDANEAYESGDLVIVPHWERLPGQPSSSDVEWPGENALDNWYDSIDYDVFNCVYDVYYLGEKLDPKFIWPTASVPTSTFCTPVWNEETQQFDYEFDEDGIGSFRLQNLTFADNGSAKTPVKGTLSDENLATIPMWRLIPFDLTNSNRIRIVYDGTWNDNENYVPYTGEAYLLTFWSTWEGIENPMYTIYWTDADGNEILLDKGYDYAGRAMNNVDATVDPTDQTTWAKPVLLGVYDFCGRYVPENGDFYIKNTEPPIQSKVQIEYKVGDTVIKTTDASIEPINMDEQAPQVDNLAYWSHQSTPGYNPIVSPIEGQDLNLVTTYAVLRGADGTDGKDGKDGQDGKDGATGPQGPTGEQGEKGDTGESGKDGISVTVLKVEWAKWTSGTIAPTLGWQTEIPEVPQGQWLWCKITYSDGHTALITSYQGIDGKDGENSGQDIINEKDNATKTIVLDKSTALNKTNTNKIPQMGDAIYSIRLLIAIMIIAAGIILLALHKRNKEK